MCSVRGASSALGLRNLGIQPGERQFIEADLLLRLVVFSFLVGVDADDRLHLVAFGEQELSGHWA